jgi:hypothetical protein
MARGVPASAGNERIAFGIPNRNDAQAPVPTPPMPRHRRGMGVASDGSPPSGTDPEGIAHLRPAAATTPRCRPTPSNAGPCPDDVWSRPDIEALPGGRRSRTFAPPRPVPPPTKDRTRVRRSKHRVQSYRGRGCRGRFRPRWGDQRHPPQSSSITPRSAPSTMPLPSRSELELVLPQSRSITPRSAPSMTPSALRSDGHSTIG